MYLEIDDKNYIIHLKADIHNVILHCVDDQYIHLQVPALLPQENLIAYIRQELPRVIKYAKKLTPHKIVELHLFDKIYPVKISETESLHIKNEVIYANPKDLGTKAKIEKLKLNLLLNFINDTLSVLEQDLNVILPEIYFKKLQTKYYSICHNTQRITYSKTLIDKSKDFITYVVILTVGFFLESSKEQIDFLINKYVSNSKHCERIYNYEQQ